MIDETVVNELMIGARRWLGLDRRKYWPEVKDEWEG